MKICVAQARPVKGDIPGNIAAHKKLVNLSVEDGADIIIFPELSLTGYEPVLAKELATNQEDKRLDCFQEMSDAGKIVIGVGLPIQNERGIYISMVIFQPHKPRHLYSKKYLHADEKGFFISGPNFTGLMELPGKIALAICYEISVPAHAANAAQQGAGLYIASVAKTTSGVEKAIETLSAVAKEYSMTVLMSNCIGICDGEQCGGRSSIWNKKGFLIGQLEETSEGILVINTQTNEITQRLLE